MELIVTINLIVIKRVAMPANQRKHSMCGVLPMAMNELSMEVIDTKR